MYPYILCFCGRPLGDLYDAFKALRRYHIAKELDLIDDGSEFDPDVYSLLYDIAIPYNEIWEQLAIHTSCCKVHMMTMAEYKDYY